MFRHIKVPFGELNIFPLFMDFDFVDKKPRGLSTKLSLFSYNKLYEIVKDTKGLQDILFIKKDSLYFKNGFFLLDYLKIKENPEAFKEKLKKTNFKLIYLEKSDLVDFEKIFENEDFEIFMVEII